MGEGGEGRELLLKSPRRWSNLCAGEWGLSVASGGESV